MKTLLATAIRFILFILLPASLWAADLVVVVNPNNSIQSISEQDAKRIFLGILRNFENGKKILLANLEEDSSLREEFYQRTTGSSAKKAKAKWTAYAFSGLLEFPEEFATEEELIEWVNKTENGIGYISAAAVNNKVKVVYQLPKEQ